MKLSGDLDGLRPSVAAALYRLAQESVTNAVRHARHATVIQVTVHGEDDSVRLTVGDDGEAGTFDPRSSSGFGLIGMAERAKLLGGTLEAGPNRNRGWTVRAVLPRGQEREAVSEAALFDRARARCGRAWPERPGPQGQEREA